MALRELALAPHGRPGGRRRAGLPQSIDRLRRCGRPRAPCSVASDRTTAPSTWSAVRPSWPGSSRSPGMRCTSKRRPCNGLTPAGARGSCKPSSWPGSWAPARRCCRRRAWRGHWSSTLARTTWPGSCWGTVAAPPGGSGARLGQAVASLAPDIDRIESGAASARPAFTGGTPGGPGGHFEHGHPGGAGTAWPRPPARPRPCWRCCWCRISTWPTSSWCSCCPWSAWRSGRDEVRRSWPRS